MPPSAKQNRHLETVRSRKRSLENEIKEDVHVFDVICRRGELTSKEAFLECSILREHAAHYIEEQVAYELDVKNESLTPEHALYIKDKSYAILMVLNKLNEADENGYRKYTLRQCYESVEAFSPLKESTIRTYFAEWLESGPTLADRSIHLKESGGDHRFSLWNSLSEKEQEDFRVQLIQRSKEFPSMRAAHVREIGLEILNRNNFAVKKN